MSSVFFNGNTYIFGATVSANPGTGTTSYVFGGLNSGATYGFILRSFNSFGFSNFVGPSIGKTITSILEERDEFVALAWTWLGNDVGPYQWDVMYSTYGITTGSDSGTTANYYVSSQDVGNTNWFAFNYVKPTWLTVTSGLTDPLGGTGAQQFTVYSPSSQTLNLRQYIGGLPAGITYVMSFYVRTDGVTGTWSVANEWRGGFSSPIGVSMQQILPVGATAASSSVSPNIIWPSGPTGWYRFAWRVYAQPVTAGIVYGTNAVSLPGVTWESIVSTIMSRTFSAGVTASAYIFGPQFEVET